MKMLLLAGVVLIASACSGGGGSAITPAPPVAPAAQFSAPRVIQGGPSGATQAFSYSAPFAPGRILLNTGTITLAAGHTYDVTVTWGPSVANETADISLYAGDVVRNPDGSAVHLAATNGFNNGATPTPVSSSYSALMQGGQDVTFAFAADGTHASGSVSAGAYTINAAVH